MAKTRISVTISEAYRKFGAKGALIYLPYLFLHGGLSSRPALMGYSAIFNPIFNLIFKLKYGSGDLFIEDEWDNLIILDACRYDDFEQINTMPGKLESKISKGRESKEFIFKNFCGRELHDTVYITANPHVKYVGENVFHEVIEKPIKEWDAEKMTVKPTIVTEAALNAYEKYPNKRLIIHYMQPHDPPLGPTAKELKEEIDLIGPVPEQLSYDQPGGTRYLHALARGEISLDKARKAYRETLQIVLTDVKYLIRNLDGKSVITADHGELFGETPYPLLGKLYGHYFHPRTPELCKVPWFHVDTNGERRTIIKNSPNSNQRMSEKDIEEKLRYLGYT